jgi:urease accessory protein
MESTQILGTLSDERFLGRTVDPVLVAWGDATKHQQRLRTNGGREIAVRLPRGTFLAVGTVLWDDGTTVVSVGRPLEEAIVVDFADNTGPDAVRRALLLGYLLGNQHAPLEVSAERIKTPLMTGAETAEQTLRNLHLNGRVERVELAPRGWSNTSSDHHGHSHAR